MNAARVAFAGGALLLVCLLGFSSTGTGERSATSDLPPSGPDSALMRQGEIHRKLLLQSAHREAPKPPDPAPTCGELLVLVDRSHALPEDYAPGDLVSLPEYGVPTVGGRNLALRREAAEHLRALTSSATASGEELVVASAFRSYRDQELTHARLKSIYGSGADAMSATPGHSQHQLGTAVDFTNAVAAYGVRPVFGKTGAAWWLRKHAAKYGFALSYPPGKDQTGYRYEPWHYRYIGTENAGRLERSGLSLQEFLVREGVLPDC